MVRISRLRFMLGLGASMVAWAAFTAVSQAAPPAPVYSGEAVSSIDGCNNNSGGRNAAELLDDGWQATAAADGNPYLSRIDLPNLAEPLSPYPPAPLTFPGTDVTVVVTKRGVASADRTSTAPNTFGVLEGPATEPDYATSATLQECAPRPASLYNTSNQPVLWNATAGSGSSHDAALFEFSQPVRAFGAWFGDVETRTDGEGQPAYVKLFAVDGSVVSVTPIVPDTADQNQCGGTSANRRSDPAGSLSICGNRATRWIGFSSTTPDVAAMLVIVGDDDDCTAFPADCDGLGEHVSFIGPTLAYTTQVDVVKSMTGNADEDGSGDVSLGDTLRYTIDVTNSGDATLTDVTASDPMPGLSALACSPAQPTTLASGATMSCVATYLVTQGDVDAGRIDNTVTAQAERPGGDPGDPADDVTDTDSETVLPNQAASIAMDKTLGANADEDGSGAVSVGDTLTYQLDAANTGVVTLTSVGVSDPKPGLSTLACSPAVPSTLAPGAMISCTATYTVTQADVDAGSIVNTATAAGTPPAGPDVTDDGSANVAIAQTPGAEFAKTLGGNADEDGSGDVSENDTLTYAFTGTNTGNLRLDGVVTSDPLVGLSPVACGPTSGGDPFANDGTDALDPGESVMCSATYQVTEGDADAGSINNVATLTATDATGTPHTVTAAIATAVGNGAAPDLAVSTDVESITDDTIVWTVLVRNVGDAGATGPIGIADQLPIAVQYIGASSAAATCSLSGQTLTCDHPGDLLPGQELSILIETGIVGGGVITNTVSVTQADGETALDNNVASATISLAALPSTGLHSNDLLRASLLFLGLGTTLLLTVRFALRQPAA